MDNHDKARVQRRINKLIRRNLLADKKIILFGASSFSKDVFVCLRQYGISVSAIVDNDSRKIGTHCLGMIVQTPEDALIPFNSHNVVLFYSPAFYEEITAQLERMSYKMNRHIFKLNDERSDSIWGFALLTYYKLRGQYWYKKIVRRHTKNCKIFLAPYTGTGDIYIVGLFFNEYLRKNKITDYVFAVVSNACRKVAEMFGIKNIVVLPHQVTDDIISLELSSDRNLNIIVLNDGWMGDPIQWMRGFKGLNFEKMFRYFVFNFDNSVQLKLPPPKDYRKEISALFEKYGLVKGKTVVLAPYSNTLFDLPDDTLASIVFHCKKRGYTVCTNCAGTEKAVMGTNAVFFPLNQAITFMDEAGYFIGVRSGLCDIISLSSCKKIILYEKEGLFYKSSQYEYFSLEKMGLCDDAMEIEYHDDLRENVLNQIFSVL